MTSVSTANFSQHVTEYLNAAMQNQQIIIVGDGDDRAVLLSEKRLRGWNQMSPGHRTLAERLTAFYEKPLEQIQPVRNEEYDWGKPKGREVW